MLKYKLTFDKMPERWLHGDYDYTVEVRNRFKGLDLIDRVPDELQNEVRDIGQQTGIKTIPMEKKWKKKQNDCLRRPYK